MISVFTSLPRLRGASRLIRCFSASQDMAPLSQHTTQPHNSLCRTTQSDPSLHTIHHEGLFYTIQDEDVERWMKQGAQTTFYQLWRAVRESCLMVRRPAVEIMECMRAANYSLPVIPYVLYGDEGCGKTCSLLHLIHSCGRQNWLVIHIPWSAHLNRYTKISRASIHKEGRIDQPYEATQWIRSFKQMNAHLLKNTELKTSHNYVWSKRETTEPGSHITELMDFGLSRPKFACDVYGAVLKELKVLSTQGRCRLLVAIDGVNSLWQSTNVKTVGDKRKKHLPEELTMICHLKNLITNDWSGGAVVCTVDKYANTDYLSTDSYVPRSLLQKEGFDHLDPFVAVHVPDYTEKEALSCINYYRDRKFITHPQAGMDAGIKELLFLSSCNPMALYKTAINW